MIIFDRVSKIYNPGGEEVRALDGVSLRIEEGEFAAVVGPSGSGKSTLMHIMGCLDIATAGAYYLDGQPIDYYTEDDLSAVRGHKIGFVFQSFNLISRMSIEENVELPLVYLGIKPSMRRQMTEYALELVGLANRKKHKPNQVSGGQQQRAAIARAIVTDPALILADEPTGNLDSKTGLEVMQHFHALNAAGKTIVLITHDNNVASRANRVIRIMDGKIASDSKYESDGTGARAPDGNHGSGSGIESSSKPTPDSKNGTGRKGKAK